MTLVLDTEAPAQTVSPANGASGAFQTMLTGIQIHGNPTFEDWIRELDSVWFSGNAVNWAVGDLMLYGEDKFGEKFAQAVDNTRWKIHTLQNIMTTCRAFTPDERRPNVAFSSHAECASLTGENRKLAMDNLESGVWNRAQVRAYKKQLKGDSTPKTKTVSVNPVKYHSDGKHLIVVFDCQDVPPNVISWHVKVEAA